eukprot:snap_masked-scaffold_13-processed-gene-5.23-mRNA-1 protein AED:1.00 eAED:1.00 QI:0/-1/0/0/-1/1/1/0/64
MLKEALLQSIIDLVNHRSKATEKGSGRQKTFKPWNKQIRSSEIDFFVTNKPTAVASFKVSKENQ